MDMSLDLRLSVLDLLAALLSVASSESLAKDVAHEPSKAGRAEPANGASACTRKARLIRTTSMRRRRS